MTLPEHSEGKYPLLKPGKYTFRITDPPEMRRYGKATGIIIKFSAINEFGEGKDNSVLMFPFPDRKTGYCAYRILKDEIIKSSEEADWVGRSFMGEIEIGPHPTKNNQQQQKIVNIQPFPKADGSLAEKEQPEPEPEPEVEDTTVTPPLEEEGDPGPEEKDAPPKEDEKDEIEQNKKNCPKEDDDEAPF